MLVAVAFSEESPGVLRARAPDLPGCDLRGSTEQELLPRLRLAIEAAVTDLLLAGSPLPDTREGQPPAPGTPADGGRTRWLQIHINVGHLVALAAHQRGRPGPVA